MLKLDPKLLEAIMREQFATAGLADASIEHVVGAMLETSLRGVDSHGVVLFPHYYKALLAGRIARDPQFRTVREEQATAVVDADHGFGHHAGRHAMALAEALAVRHGLGAVAVRHSSHFGAAAYFALPAARAGYLGFAFTNADALAQAFNAKRAFFGTNPICVAAPMEGEEPLCLDMATSTASWNRIRNHRRSHEALEPGWASDAHGEPTLDPDRAVMLSTIGGYKGFGLGLTVELLCGFLADGPAATELLPMFNSPLEAQRKISHLFLCVAIDRFVPIERFRRRLSMMAREIRALGRADSPMMVPGDPEKAAFAERAVHGIPMLEEHFEQYLDINPRFRAALRT